MNILEIENVKTYTESKPLYLLKWIAEHKLARFEETAKEKFAEEIMENFAKENKIEYTIILSSIVNSQDTSSKVSIIKELEKITPETMMKISRSSIVGYQVLAKFRKLNEDELKNVTSELINFLNNKEFDFNSYLIDKKTEITTIEDNIYNSILNDKYEVYEEKNLKNNVVKAMCIYDTGIIIYADIGRKDGFFYVVEDTEKNLLKDYMLECKVPQLNIVSEILKSRKKIIPETFIEIVNKGGLYNEQLAQCFMFAEKHGITAPRANFELAKFYVKDPIQRNPDKAVGILEKVAKEGIADAYIELAKFYLNRENLELAIENYENAQNNGYDVANEIQKLKTKLYENNTEVERLQPLRDIMEKYKERTKKDCYKITLEKEEIPGILDSKIGGNPYIPEGDDIPKDKNGDYMALAIQINFADVESSIYPSSGILEIFMDKSLGYPCEYKIKFYKEISDNYKTEFPKIDVSEFFYKGTSKIKLEKSVAYMPGADYRTKDTIKSIVDEIINDSELVDKLKQIVKIDYKEHNMEKYAKSDEELIYQLLEVGLYDYIENAPIMLGGYGDFTQTDPRVYEAEKKRLTECLVKIDENGDEEFCIGDAGIISVLISEEDLRNKNFENAVLDWDCL